MENNLIHEMEDKIAAQKKAFHAEIQTNISDADVTNPFESAKMLRAKASAAVDEAIDSIQKPLTHGFEVVLKELHAKNPTYAESLAAWFNSHLAEVNQLMDETPSALSLSQQLHFPDEFLVVIFATGRDLLEQKKYVDAEDVFLLCTTFEPKVPDFWLNYGASLQGQHKHVEALYAFQTALLFDLENPSTYAYMAKSWLGLEKPVEAKEALKKALIYSKGRENNEEFICYCYALAEYCNKKHK